MVPNLLFVRLTASASLTHYRKSTQIQLGSLLQHKNNVFLLLFNSFTSGTSSDSESDASHHKGDTFTVSYLINSCGVSPTLAVKLSNKVRLKNPNGPNAVLDLLKTYGFSKTHITKLVVKRPRLLAARAENTLLPKLNFFRSIGVSNSDMPKLIIANSMMLRRSLEKCLIPRYEVLRSIVRDDHEVVRALKNAPYGFTFGDVINDLAPNIEFLRRSGVPPGSISLLMMHSRSTAYTKHSKFLEAVKAARQFGFNPLRATFVVAIEILVKSKAVLESRFEVYERWGWNREMSLKAFRKFPCFMKLSEEMFSRKMNFLVKDMHLPAEDIAEYPLVLSYNLEKRIIPRFSVIKILKSKGLIENSLRFSSFICLAEEDFLEKFVINFQKALPLLPGVYRGVINHLNVM
ncbi:hypothetical protein VNO77_42867 [Canavalia gladiata]|uniref:Uncharacterized protein n=1 Tax=Canavalia gladiata TaxID=3824 RepID=A0AAN9PMG2_CANGL